MAKSSQQQNDKEKPTNENSTKGKPAKADLIRLVNRIQKESGCIVDLDALISKFERSVPNPSASRFIFDSPTGRELTPEEIVDLALKSNGI